MEIGGILLLSTPLGTGVRNTEKRIQILAKSLDIQVNYSLDSELISLLLSKGIIVVYLLVVYKYS